MSGSHAAAAPCAVRLCPALARPGSRFCSCHRTAKKLDQLGENARCAACNKLLVVGEYVTLESTLTRIYHAVCPKDRPRAERRPKGDTPLLNAAPERPVV